MAPAYRSLLDGVEFPVDESPVPQRIRDRVADVVADQHAEMLSVHPCSVYEVYRYGLAHPGGIPARNVERALKLSSRTVKRAHAALRDLGLATSWDYNASTGHVSCWTYQPEGQKAQEPGGQQSIMVGQIGLASVEAVPRASIFSKPVTSENGAESARGGRRCVKKEQVEQVSTEVPGPRVEVQNPVTHSPVAHARHGATARLDQRPVTWTASVDSFAETGIEQDLADALEYFWTHLVHGEYRCWFEHVTRAPEILAGFLLVGGRAAHRPATLVELMDALDWMFSAESGCRRPDTAAALERYIGQQLDRPVPEGATAEQRRRTWACASDPMTAPEPEESPVSELTDAIASCTDGRPQTTVSPKLDALRSRFRVVATQVDHPAGSSGDLDEAQQESRRELERLKAQSGVPAVQDRAERPSAPRDGFVVPEKTREALRAAEARIGRSA